MWLAILGATFLVLAMSGLMAAFLSYLIRWSLGATLLVIGLSGIVTVSLSYLFLGYGEKGLFTYPVEPGPLSWSALPTAIFVSASLIRRKSPAMQRFVATAAVVVALLIGGTVCFELSRRFVPSRTGPGTGFISLLAELAGSLSAVMVFIIAAGAALWSWYHKE